MEPDEHRHNPNVCASCERLLEDDSPMLMADMAGRTGSGADELLDQPASQPKPEPEPNPESAPPKQSKPSVK
jgi:hypothetical protein